MAVVMEKQVSAKNIKARREIRLISYAVLMFAASVFTTHCWAQNKVTSNLLRNANFESGMTSWTLMGGGDSPQGDHDARYEIRQGAGHDGLQCIAYHKTADGTANHHLDNNFTAQSHATYVFGAWIRGDGRLRPRIGILDKQWKCLGSASAPPSTEWTLVQGVFDTGEAVALRFEWWAGSRGNPGQGYAGEAFMNDAFVRFATPQDLASLTSPAVTIDTTHPLRKISPLCAGVNLMNAFDNDVALRDGRLARLLREAGIGLLRFPGGHDADYYDWTSNMFDFPCNEHLIWEGAGPKNFRGGPEMTDTSKFMPFCRAVGAEPMFVVNFGKVLQGPGLEAAVRNAADWVRYCNIERRYGIKYWEIGNETYSAIRQTATTTEHYANAFTAFARAMKAVDPTILIGANGPPDIESAGKLDTVPWWPVLLKRAIGSIDFIIIHEYSRGYVNFADYRNKGLDFGFGARAMREYLQRNSPAHAGLPIAITEWNINSQFPCNSLGHALVAANMLGDFLREGVAMAEYWPLRVPSPRSVRALLDYQTLRPQPVYYAVQAFGTMARGSLVAAQQNIPDNLLSVYPALTEDGRSLNVFIVNKQERPIECDLKLNGFVPTAKASLHILGGPGIAANNDKNPENVVMQTQPLAADSECRFSAPGPSLCVVEMKRRSGPH